ncbi:MAG: sugar ABC transporter permease [Nitrososphaerota archaeon]
MKYKKSLYEWIYILPTLAILTTLFIFPLFFNFWISFQEKFLGKEAVFAGLKNYIRMFNSPTLYVSLLNTFIYAFTAVFFKTLIGLTVALFLNMKFKGRGFLRGLSILPWALPMYVVCVLFWLNYYSKGTFNNLLQLLGLKPIYWLGFDYAMPSVILVNVWHGWPFFFMGILAGLQAVPIELYESAEIDGASSFQKFIHITLPFVKPVILTVALLSLMWTMGDFTTIYMMTSGGPVDRTLTIPMASFQIAFFKEVNIPLAAAYTIIILPIYLILIFFTIRQMR